MTCACAAPAQSDPAKASVKAVFSFCFFSTWFGRASPNEVQSGAFVWCCGVMMRRQRSSYWLWNFFWAASICCFTASILKLAPFCIGGNSMKVSASSPTAFGHRRSARIRERRNHRRQASCGNLSASIGEPACKTKVSLLSVVALGAFTNACTLPSNFRDVDISARSPEVRPAGRREMKLIALQER